jgi:hypothetical protein
LQHIIRGINSNVICHKHSFQKKKKCNVICLKHSFQIKNVIWAHLISHRSIGPTSQNLLYQKSVSFEKLINLGWIFLLDILDQFHYSRAYDNDDNVFFNLMQRGTTFTFKIYFVVKKNNLFLHFKKNFKKFNFFLFQINIFLLFLDILMCWYQK